MKNKNLERKLLEVLIEENNWTSDNDNPEKISELENYEIDGDYAIIILEDPLTYVKLQMQDGKVTSFDTIDPATLTLKDIDTYYDQTGGDPFQGSTDAIRSWIVKELKVLDISRLSKDDLKIFTFLTNDSMKNSPLRDYDFDMPWMCQHVRFCLTAIQKGAYPWEIQ